MLHRLKYLKVKPIYPSQPHFHSCISTYGVFPSLRLSTKSNSTQSKPLFIATIKLVRSVGLLSALLKCFDIYDVFVKWRYILNMILLTPECPKSTSVKCLFILIINQITYSSVKHYGLVNHFQSSDQDHVFLHWICGEMRLFFLFFVRCICLF